MYVEQDCTIEHEGKTFEAGGAVVTDDYAVGYFKLNTPTGPTITDWHGKPLGPANIVSKWRVYPYASDMMQVRATIGKVLYSGRTQGDGMIWRGKPMK